MNEIREKDIENYLVKKVKELGGVAYKFTSPSRRSVPDRLVVCPGNRIAFVEVKRPGNTPTQAQQREMQKLADLGCVVTWVDSYDLVDEFIKVIKWDIVSEVKAEESANDNAGGTQKLDS